jgi:hypothetical protein
MIGEMIILEVVVVAEVELYDMACGIAAHDAVPQAAVMAIPRA